MWHSKKYRYILKYFVIFIVECADIKTTQKWSMEIKFMNPLRCGFAAALKIRVEEDTAGWFYWCCVIKWVCSICGLHMPVWPFYNTWACSWWWYSHMMSCIVLYEEEPRVYCTCIWSPKGSEDLILPTGSCWRLLQASEHSPCISRLCCTVTSLTWLWCERASGPHTMLMESVSDHLSRHMHICGHLWALAVSAILPCTQMKVAVLLCDQNISQKAWELRSGLWSPPAEPLLCGGWLVNWL